MKNVPPASARLAAPMKPPLVWPIPFPVFSWTGPRIHASSGLCDHLVARSKIDLQDRRGVTFDLVSHAGQSQQDAAAGQIRGLRPPKPVESARGRRTVSSP